MKNFGIVGMISIALSAAAFGSSGKVSQLTSHSHASQSIPCPFADHADLKARVDNSGIGGSKLIVTGRVLAPFDDYAAKLKDSGFIKVFKPIHLLDLSLVEAPGAKKGWQDIRFEGKGQSAYQSVVITCHGKIFAQIQPVTTTP